MQKEKYPWKKFEVASSHLFKSNKGQHIDCVQDKRQVCVCVTKKGPDHSSRLGNICIVKESKSPKTRTPHLVPKIQPIHFHQYSY